MDGQMLDLQEKLNRLLKEAAEVAVRLDRANGTSDEIPHYSVIEMRAHLLGRQLSRDVQEQQMKELMTVRIPKAKCPQCGTRCEVIPKKRTINSIDGPVEVQEPEARCPFCRRAFFPSAGDIGV